MLLCGLQAHSRRRAKESRDPFEVAALGLVRVGRLGLRPQDHAGSNVVASSKGSIQPIHLPRVRISLIHGRTGTGSGTIISCLGAQQLEQMEQTAKLS